MRHLLIGLALVLVSLLAVQFVAAALEISATKGHEADANFIPGELPRGVLPTSPYAGQTTPPPAKAALPERARPGPRPVDLQTPVPSTPPAAQPQPAPPGLRLPPTPTIPSATDPNASRA